MAVVGWGGEEEDSKPREPSQAQDTGLLGGAGAGVTQGRPFPW